MLNNCEAKGQGCVLTLPIYRGREQHGNGQEAGDKGTGSGRVRYGRREVLTPLSPPPPPPQTMAENVEGFEPCVEAERIGSRFCIEKGTRTVNASPF